jgi:hypothetical protein
VQEIISREPVGSGCVAGAGGSEELLGGLASDRGAQPVIYDD